MERLAAFELMLSDIQKQSEYEKEQMERLKSQGKEKSATYRQYFGNRMLYKMILEKYQEYGLIDEQYGFLNRRNVNSEEGKDYDKAYRHRQFVKRNNRGRFCKA